MALCPGLMALWPYVMSLKPRARVPVESSTELYTCFCDRASKFQLWTEAVSQLILAIMKTQWLQTVTTKLASWRTLGEYYQLGSLFPSVIAVIKFLYIYIYI